MSDEFKNEEGIDNTNAVANIVETGDMHEVAMILGSRERIRHAGVIRPGIKIPLSGCSQKQKDIYVSMLDDGHGFSEIDAAMLSVADKTYTKKTCLRPSNSDYFTIRDEDFKRPADAQYIRKNYSDSDGKVRRIPCWLPFSDIEKVIPHNFRAFNAGGLRCVSFYDEGRLKFKYLPKGFVTAPKPEDWLVLDSDDEDKATKACGIDVKFGGMYRVYVPGTRGAGEIVCPTQSWYGLGESVGVLKRVRSILGRFDGLFNGNAFFELCKVAETVKNPEGKRVQQWIVTLELMVDPMELARYAEPSAVVARSATAMQLLTGKRNGTPSESPCHIGPYVPVPGGFIPPDEAGLPEIPLNLPSATNVASESGASPESLATNQVAIDALVKLIAPAHLFLADIETLYAASYKGAIMSDATLEELRAFYGVVAVQLKSHSEQFISDVKALRNP